MRAELLDRPTLLGHGHATVAVRLLLQFAFDALDLAHLFATPFKSNSASQRVLEKNGFILRGLQTHNESLKSQERIAMYDLTRGVVECTAGVVATALNQNN